MDLKFTNGVLAGKEYDHVGIVFNRRLILDTQMKDEGKMKYHCVVHPPFVKKTRENDHRGLLQN